MARMLYRLGSTAFRRWPLFIAGWLLFAVVLGSVAAAFSKPMSDEFTIPGIPSEAGRRPPAGALPGGRGRVRRRHRQRGRRGARGPHPRRAGVPGADRRPDRRDPVAAADERRPRGQPGPGRPERRGCQRAAGVQPAVRGRPDRHRVASSGTSTPPPTSSRPRSRLPRTSSPSTPTEVQTASSVEANGAGMQSMSPPGGASELIGIGIALVVLLLTFGSAIAAGMPIITADLRRRRSA